MTAGPCFGCGAIVPDVDGPTHPYIHSSAGCWKKFGEVQAQESRRFGYPPAHRLVVDAYAAQHPGDGSDRRDRQSVFVHLVALCAMLERGLAPASATRLLGTLVHLQGGFPRLERDSGPGDLTVLHMLDAPDYEGYERRAREWADAVWGSWAEHHETIRKALAAGG
ncbi:DUF5946 family protein [Gryllotalpicola reticulitermitis]|uniref:DUF5946 family protein n=1 Tax=Gryllotalpicola reticulitermitis TaxID=1184153 RepID=A0ABV8Q045_9MICO